MEFKFPLTCVVSGPTRSGKTEFVKRLIKSNLVSPPPERIIWCYGQWQDGYKDLVGVEMIEGLPDIQMLKSDKSRKLLVCDDLMQAYDSKNDDMNTLFCAGSHHWNLGLIHIVQNLFYGKMRTARINCSHIVLLKNPSDRLQVMSLARQLYPTNQKYLVESFDDATSLPYGHLVIDMDPRTADDMRLRTSVFDEIGYVYQPKNYK